MSSKPQPLVAGINSTPLDQTAFKTSGSGAALQAQPKRSVRTVRVEINSSDRNQGKQVLSSQFRWIFPFPVKEIREIRLVSGNVPVPFLNIDVGWNRFIFRENTTDQEVEIPPGYYRIDTLITKLDVLINGLGLGQTYVVDQLPNSNQIRFRTTNVTPLPFGLMFATGRIHDLFEKNTGNLLQINTPARILGFGFGNQIAIAGEIVAPRCPNLWQGLERSYLQFNFDNSIDMRNVLRGAGRKEPTAIFYQDELNVQNLPTTTENLYPMTKQLNKETFDSILVSAPAPLSRISQIDIALTDEFQRPINTQGREMSLLVDMVIAD